MRKQAGLVHVIAVIILILALLGLLGFLFWQNFAGKDGGRANDQQLAIDKEGVFTCPSEQFVDEKGGVPVLISRDKNQCIQIEMPKGWKINKSEDHDLSDTISFEYRADAGSNTVYGSKGSQDVQNLGITGELHVSFVAKETEEDYFDVQEVLNFATNKTSGKSIYIVEADDAVRLSSCEPKPDFDASGFKDTILCMLKFKDDTQSSGYHAVDIVLWNVGYGDGSQLRDAYPAEEPYYDKAHEDLANIAKSLFLSQ